MRPPRACKLTSYYTNPNLYCDSRLNEIPVNIPSTPKRKRQRSQSHESTPKDSAKKTKPLLLFSPPIVSRNLDAFSVLPTEIVQYILQLTEDSHETDVQQMNQHNILRLVCRFWKQLIKSHDYLYAANSYRTVYHLSRVMGAEHDRAQLARRITVDLSTDEVFGCKHYIANTLQACTKLQGLDLTFLGRDRFTPEAACLSVPLFEAFMKLEELEEFRISFRRAWTALTLGGDMKRALNKFKRIKKLYLPRLLVNRLNPTFNFHLNLTHLGLHLDGYKESKLLLTHLIKTSSQSLRHLSLSVQSVPNVCDLSDLQIILSPVLGQLLSFKLVSAYQTLYPEPVIVSTSLVLAQLVNVKAIELGNRVMSDLTHLSVLTSLPRLREVTFHSFQEDFDEIVNYFAAAPATLNVVHLTLEGWYWTGPSNLSNVYINCPQKKMLEKRGILLSTKVSYCPSEEDEYDDDDDTPGPVRPIVPIVTSNPATDTRN